MVFWWQYDAFTVSEDLRMRMLAFRLHHYQSTLSARADGR